MDALAELVNQRRQQLLDVVERVCGACGKTCCHQGTMMGSTDLRRLHKGLQLDPRLRARLGAGLRQRGGELRTELEAMEQIARLLERADSGEKGAELELLRERLDEWRRFCDRLESPEEWTFEGLGLLLRFSAIRANVLRVLREFPGAVEALANHAALGGLLHAGGRRMAPPACLFLGTEGCLAEGWKPAKCANFFCAGEPNLLAEITAEMGFEDFVRANFRTMSPNEVLSYVELELALGREFLEPKVLIQPNAGLAEALDRLLRLQFVAVESRREAGPFMWSTAEAYGRLCKLPPTVAYVVEADEVSGGGLYELAVALDRLRVEGTPPAFYLRAERLSESSFLPHPLWADQMMSQPLGFLDLIVVER